jgi:hypothetical protein
VLKIYSYTVADLGWQNVPDAEAMMSLRFDDQCEKVNDPEQADVILVPPILYNLRRQGLEPQSLRHMRQTTFKKHVFLDVADNFDVFPTINSIFLRCCLTRKMYGANHRSRCVAWPVSSSGDYSDIVALPAGGFKYDVGFHGWVRGPDYIRHKAAESCRRELGARADIATYPDFCGYIWETPEGLRRRAEFRRSLHECRLQLCPASIEAGPVDGRGGVFPYRVFETMAAGRVPLMFCTDHMWPREDKIEWSRTIFCYPESEAGRAGEIAKEIVATHSDDQLVAMGQRCRELYLAHLDDRHWPRIHREMVERLLWEEAHPELM